MNCIQAFIDIVNDYIVIENITVHEFSKRINVVESAVAKWLNATYVPAIHCALKVSDLLNCSVDYLFGLTEKADFVRGSEKTKFIERFEILCKRNNLSYYQVAKNCKFGQSMISKWKKGKYPKTETLIKVARYFDCSIEYLIGRSDIF